MRVRERERETDETLGGEVSKTEITEDDFGGVEEMKSTAIMTAEKKSLSLHINIGGIGSNGGDFIGEEDRR